MKKKALAPRVWMFGLAVWLFCCHQVDAHGGALEEVMVLGRKSNVSFNRSAAEGVVAREALDTMVLERAGDLLERVPGLVATQHSGSGKANQYFLRGFNLDHGTDFSTRVDFMPVNMVSHAHGQGYSDLNFVIPEMIDSIDYRKGPYFADVGDFSAAGGAHIRSVSLLDENRLALQVGGYGYRRALAINQTQVGVGQWIAALELQQYDGPWVNLEEAVLRKNVWLKYAAGGDRDGLDLSFMAYRNGWNAADQIPLRAIDNGTIASLSAIDPSSGGEAYRDSLSALKTWHSSATQWLVSTYAIRSGLDLWSNFTYFTQPQGDQIYQREKRQIYGGDLVRSQLHSLGQRDFLSTFGLQLRYDRIAPVSLYETEARQVQSLLRQDQLRQWSNGLYWQGTLQMSPQWRLTAAARYNEYQFQVKAQEAAASQSLAANSGTKTAGRWTGSLRTGYSLTDNLDVFFNLGRSFHSNDGRGVLQTRDASGNDDVVADVSPSADPLVALDGFDIGGSWRSDQWQVSAALWWLASDSELLFVGDAGKTEDSASASLRRGVELTLGWQPSGSAQLEVDYAWSHATLSDAADKPVPGALEQVLSLRFQQALSERWSTSLRWRYFGEYPLGGSVKAAASQKWDGGVRFDSLGRFILSLDMLNLLDSSDYDIEYWYESQLPDEPASVADRHVHQMTPRTIRIKIEVIY